MNKKIAILCSCAGFGTYTPALLLRDELKETGAEVELFVFENYLSNEGKESLIRYRKQFHEDFRFAVMASNLAYHTSFQEIDYVTCEEIFNYKKFDSFLVLYGEWLNVLSTICIQKDKILCIHLDAANTPSWSKSQQLERSYETIWLVGKNGDIPNYKLQPRTRVRSCKNIILHGGGWGIDSYLKTIDSIDNKYDLSIIYSSRGECRGQYLELYIPISWWPNCNKPDYPTLINAKNESPVDFQLLCKNSCAIISKPGGGSCLDCLRYAFPLIYLDPMARHERENALLFEELGFAISYDQWARTGCSFQVIQTMQARIVKELRSVPLLSEYICR